MNYNNNQGIYKKCRAEIWMSGDFEERTPDAMLYPVKNERKKLLLYLKDQRNRCR